VLEWPEFAGESPPEPLPPDSPGLALSIGVFDGVHRGHQELIRRIVSQSPLSTVLTFRQNPRRILSPDQYRGDIFSLRQKLAVFEALGLSRVVLIDFSGNFSKLSGREFIDLLKSRCRIGYMALGMNFRCGCRLDTGAQDIKAWMNQDGIAMDLVEPVLEGRHPVSSSRIRAAISAGDLAAATALLGRKVRIDLSGMPAANAGGGRVYDAAPASRVTPPAGAYRVLVYGGSSAQGMEGEISIKDGKIFIPGAPGGPAFAAEEIEFMVCP
jgi:riboflavin kinase/FMN adenylyltransferase